MDDPTAGKAVPAITTRATTLMRACSLVQAIAVTPNPALSGGRNTFLIPADARRETESHLFPAESGAVQIPNRRYGASISR